MIPKSMPSGLTRGSDTGFRKKIMLKQRESDGLMQRSWIGR
jgi:hypothetical protein